ncbi:lactate utilization protein C [Streptomyces sp. P38-E01]|uniref:Lactate utilization protein C n=1 Tax=Streptomyces tardus TaxID=2780544 RepID=A0A949JL16_9ACTN|nr:lactate utilization protein C [Streptomyces tardus]MBU7600733.1 lactate utilization protein C [Streptomyces tardus]
MSSRERVLARVRRALADVPREERPQDVVVDRGYLEVHGSRTPAQTVDLLAENLADYRARVHRTDAADLPGLLARLTAEREAETVLAASGLPAAWVSAVGSPDGVATVVTEHDGLTLADLDGVDTVVTGCALAIAETGTIVLDSGPGQGRRRSTLVPDHHICVVDCGAQVVDSVVRALERLDLTRPLTWISGPSATSDIELDRVEGVHGPRMLEVVLLDPPL